MKRVYKYFFEIFNSFGNISRSGIVGFLEHMVVLFFNFWGTPYCFPQRLHHFIIPPTVHRGFNFFTSSPTLIFYFSFLFFFCNGHSNQCEMICHEISFAFPWLSGTWSITLCLLVVCRSSLKKCLLKSCPFFNQIIWSFFVCFWGWS